MGCGGGSHHAGRSGGGLHCIGSTRSPTCRRPSGA